MIVDGTYLPESNIQVADIVNTATDDKDYMVYEVDDNNAKLASTDGEDTITVKKNECYKSVDNEPEKSQEILLTSNIRRDGHYLPVQIVHDLREILLQSEL